MAARLEAIFILGNRWAAVTRRRVLRIVVDGDAMTDLKQPDTCPTCGSNAKEERLPVQYGDEHFDAECRHSWHNSAPSVPSEGVSDSLEPEQPKFRAIDDMGLRAHVPAEHVVTRVIMSDESKTEGVSTGPDTPEICEVCGLQKAICSWWRHWALSEQPSSETEAKMKREMAAALQRETEETE